MQHVSGSMECLCGRSSHIFTRLEMTSRKLQQTMACQATLWKLPWRTTDAIKTSLTPVSLPTLCDVTCGELLYGPRRRSAGGSASSCAWPHGSYRTCYRSRACRGPRASSDGGTVWMDSGDAQ